MAYDQQIKLTKNSTDVVPVVTMAPQAAVTGSITTSTSTVTATDLQGIGAATVAIYGTYAGVNVTFEVFDGVNWSGIPAQPVASIAPTVSLTSEVLTANSTNLWHVGPLLGEQQFRVRATAFTSGSASVIIDLSAQTHYSVQPISGTVTANLGTAGTAATSLGKAEDAVHASGDVGVATWGVRNDGAATSFASANGDYTPHAVDTNGTQFIREAPANTATLSSVAASVTSVSLMAANTSRRAVVIYNDSTSDMYVKYGTAASNTSYTIYLPSFATTTIQGGEYAGVIHGIWITATGNARVTETI